MVETIDDSSFGPPPLSQKAQIGKLAWEYAEALRSGAPFDVKRRLKEFPEEIREQVKQSLQMASAMEEFYPKTA
ncbi:hypothetical protein HY213_03220 [Candidatus Peregrinibacteria bacterium]|nr:hypothetical protein [Candidatus Peregrinibacteria bacterium]